jgi:hypothetical protein
MVSGAEVVGELDPEALAATTEKVYEVPTVRPETT